MNQQILHFKSFDACAVYRVSPLPDGMFQVEIADVFSSVVDTFVVNKHDLDALIAGRNLEPMEASRGELLFEIYTVA